MKLPHFDHTGKALTDITVSPSLFAAKISPVVLAQAIRVYQDRQHQHTSKVKTRGEVSLTTAKWFRQKGTGRARHGAQSAPIFVGGGVAHGPKGLLPKTKTLPQKIRHLSLIAALTNKAQSGQILLLSDLDQIPAKTTTLQKLLKKLQISTKTLLLTSQTYPNLNRAATNLGHFRAYLYQRTNAYQVLKAPHLIIDQAALPLLETWLVKGNKKIIKSK